MLHGVCPSMRVSIAPGKLMYLTGEDPVEVLGVRFYLKTTSGFFFVELETYKERCCERADTSWELNDQLTPSEKQDRIFSEPHLHE